MKGWLLNMLRSDQQEIALFALQGAIRSGISDQELFGEMLNTIEQYREAVPIHDIGFLLNPVHPEGEDNYLKLIEHFKTITNQTIREEYFSTLYLYGFYHYNASLFLELVSEDEQDILKDVLYDYEKIGHYALDELFLQLFNILIDSEEKQFYQLNHCYLEMIISHILKFPPLEVVRYLESSFKEEQLPFHMVGYLFYITAHLKEESLTPYLKHFISTYPDIQDRLLSRFFHLWPREELLKEMIKRDCGYLTHLISFSEEVQRRYTGQIIEHGSRDGAVIFTEVAAFRGQFDQIDQLIAAGMIQRGQLEFPLAEIRALSQS